MKKILLSLVVLLGLVSTAFADQNSPKIEINGTINQIVDTVTKFPGDTGAKDRRDKLREIINPRFDFSRMAQLSLGANWNEITAEDQKEFTAVFSDLLAKTYLSKIETVKPGMVSVETETLDSTGQKATVKTLVTNKGDVFPIDYKLLNNSGEWKVYDVVIENVGLVVNYRNEFAGIIRKEKFSGLMQRLRDKSKG